jgi:hypothetical protein
VFSRSSCGTQVFLLQTEKSAHMSARPAYLDGYVSLEIRADPTFAWSFIFVY